MAWGVPKIGTLVESASGNFTLLEPAGIAEGDLMVACIAYRSNASITLTGWTAVAAQNSGDTDATNGIASAAMFWTNRGAAAPNLSATRTGGDVALAVIIAYGTGGIKSIRSNGNGATLASASATVTVPTFSPGTAEQLIVAMTSAGDTYNVTAFDATDPGTASGATDTTTAPTNGTWIERFDQSTGTGADGGLAIADAVRATSGATGTIQATVGGSARHAMVVSSFRLDPSTYTQAEAAFYEDGTEAGASVIDSGADSITRDVSGGDSNLQLRIRLQNSNSVAGLDFDDYQLQYEKNDSGVWESVGVGTEVVGFNSGSLTDGNATTNRLGAGTGSFVAGKISEDGSVDNLLITAGNYTELLYSLTIDASEVADNDTLDFRVIRNGETTGLTYTVTPRITIEAGGDTLTVSDGSHAHSSDSIGLTQLHNLTVADASHGHTTDAVALTQVHTLAVADAAHGHSVDNTDLTENKTLVVQDAAHGHASDGVALTQVHSLTASDGAHGHTSDSIALTQAHTLAVQDALNDHTADNVALTQAHVLVVADASHSHEGENPTLIESLALVVADGTHAHTTDGVVLTQAHTLTVQDASHGHSTDGLDLTEHKTLAVADASHDHGAEAPILTQVHNVTVADALHGHSADSLILTQQHTLTVSDGAHGHATDAVTLSVLSTLEVSDTSHGHSTDSVTVTQNHNLSVADTGHDHTAENVTIEITGGDTQLVVADAAHALAGESPALVPDYLLVVSDASHGHASEAPVVTQVHNLTVADSLHGHSSDEITIVYNIALAVQNGTHLQGTDSIDLTQAHLLVIAEAFHVLRSDSPFVGRTILTGDNATDTVWHDADDGSTTFTATDGSESVVMFAGNNSGVSEWTPGNLE